MTRVRTATVMFTDLVASTARSVRVGPARAEELRRDHYGLIRRVLADHGGAEVKTLGDGVMAVFDSVTQAVDAAVGLQQAVEADSRVNPDAPQLRVGLSVGEVSEDGADVHGRPVIEAARVCAAAGGRQVLCPAVVRALAQGQSQHVFRSVGHRDLKGLPEAVAIEEVVWAPLVESGLRADFAHVDDRSSDAAIACLDMQQQFPLLTGVRGHILELLVPQPGQVIADVGCGAGHDVFELAQIVGPDGKVVGIDKSEQLIDEARRRAGAAAINTEFRVGDAEGLPLEDHSVDGVRVDRVLQYVADPGRAIRELARVTRPDGIVVAADTDWRASVFDCDDLELTERVEDAWAATRAHGRIGSQLYGLFVRAGLRDVRVFPHNIAHTQTYPGAAGSTRRAPEYPEYPADIIAAFAAQAVEAGAVTAAEASQWIALQDTAADEHRFFRFVAMFVVTGHTPSHASVH